MPDTDEQRLALGSRRNRPSIIIVGVDGSPTSMRAASFAIGLARRQDSRLVFLYANSTGSAALVPQVIAEMLAAGAMVADEVQATIAESLHGWVGQWELRRVVGNPFRALTRLADELNADQIVVGASTHVGHRFIGSLAVHLVKTTRWPVTVVP